MTRTITLRDANQNFARYVREVQGGGEFLITRRGEPVARLVPAAGRRVLTHAQQLAYRRSMTRLKKGWHLGSWKVSRDAIHDR